jgi:hypothetical protein
MQEKHNDHNHELSEQEKILYSNAERHAQIANSILNTCTQSYLNTATGLGPEAITFRLALNREKERIVLESPAQLYGELFSIAEASYKLRPETIESVFYAYRLTGKLEYREIGWKMFEALIKSTNTTAGFSTIQDVTSKHEEIIYADRMESFFGAETMKYFYLLFSSPTVLPLDRYVLNTEAHPLSIFTAS